MYVILRSSLDIAIRRNIIKCPVSINIDRLSGHPYSHIMDYEPGLQLFAGVGGGVGPRVL
jgi:hypothetical protein